MESHFAIAQNSTPLILAPQAYVSCVLNMHACGGAGGCEGATSELAFALTETAGPSSRNTASCSLRRALLMLQINPGSLLAPR